ncbi:MAG: hypothetical protein JKY25_05185 [Robiginitomaculum sp.]|nr:hypothetical protein [Robiginitomaculum sp.]
MNFFKMMSLSSMVIILTIPSIAFAKPPVDIQKLIQKKDVALKGCIDGYKAAKYENGYMKNNPTCQLAEQLKFDINQKGWCLRWKFEHEAKEKYVSCDTTNHVSSHLDIDSKNDRPSTSSLEAEWLLPLYKSTDDVKKRDSIGFINFTCNDRDGARAMLSLKDGSSGLSGLPFKSELKIGYKLQASDAYILPTQSDRKVIVFGNENTLKILRWIHASVEDFLTVSFLAREKDTERQLYLSVSNHTTIYSDDGPRAKQWAAHMHSMCESFVRRAAP